MVFRQNEIYESWFFTFSVSLSAGFLLVRQNWDQREAVVKVLIFCMCFGLVINRFHLDFMQNVWFFDVHVATTSVKIVHY